MADHVSLQSVESAAIREIAGRAMQQGNQVSGIAPWSKALVVHMAYSLSETLKAEICAQYPGLEYYREEGSPHNPPDEGFIDGGFAISFPRPRVAG
ncbi:MAG: hypothetical protein GYB49_02595 [Alphaproteobacteria bacterium]|nr:hypothetical protein [Hyphomonas sp.]MBR9806099.1 hypothetical protein [Alphaproteobacteria bacterium]|tara:strand:+ start:892 stop:1179 length:288 start_codon:yes stop_codon:yes gene_type:complete